MVVRLITTENLGPEFDVESGRGIGLRLNETLAVGADGRLGVVAAPASFYVCQVWAEENGGLNTNQWEWSFGNGRSSGTASPGNWGLVLPWAGHIVALSLGVTTGGAGVTRVGVELNQVTQAELSLAAQATKAWRTNIEIPFGAGDVLVFKTLAAGGAAYGVMSAMLRYVIG